jgi:hypothetical protein
MATRLRDRRLAEQDRRPGTAADYYISKTCGEEGCTRRADDGDLCKKCRGRRRRKS